MASGDLLFAQQAEELLRHSGVGGPVRVRLLQRNNDVYRVEGDGAVCFLKLFTKDWYTGDVESQAYCVAHEASAYACLAAHGLATPEIALACTTPENPLDRPCLVTRQLPGAPLTELLTRAEDRQTFDTLLETAGAYLRRMHAIAFRFPGYIVGAGPTAPPDAAAWQHPCWTARAAQAAALAELERDRPRLPAALAARLEERFAGLCEALASDYAPPRFVHGDCHAHQLFLDRDAASGWRVAGVVDLEVASAGDSTADLVKFGLELAAHFPPATRWWQPFFAGYGGAPDMERYRLRLLAASEAEFKCHGPGRWPGTRAAILARLLAARDWSELFTT